VTLFSTPKAVAAAAATTTTISSVHFIKQIECYSVERILLTRSLSAVFIDFAAAAPGGNGVMQLTIEKTDADRKYNLLGGGKCTA